MAGSGHSRSQGCCLIKSCTWSTTSNWQGKTSLADDNSNNNTNTGIWNDGMLAWCQGFARGSNVMMYRWAIFKPASGSDLGVSRRNPTDLEGQTWDAAAKLFVGQPTLEEIWLMLTSHGPEQSNQDLWKTSKQTAKKERQLFTLERTQTTWDKSDCFWAQVARYICQKPYLGLGRDVADVCAAEVVPPGRHPNGLKIHVLKKCHRIYCSSW